MRRLGWSKDSLRVGEHVVIKAHASKDATRAEALFVSVRKADGSVLAMSGFAKAASDRGRSTNAEPHGLAGTWATLRSLSPDDVFGDDALKYADLWPLTPKATAAVTGFHEDSGLAR